MIKFLIKLLGDPNDRKIKAVMPIVEHINSLEAEISALSDEELKAKTTEFKEILAKRKTSKDKKVDHKLEQEALNEILPEAFAVVREAGKRVLNMRHFDVQLIGGSKGAGASTSTNQTFTPANEPTYQENEFEDDFSNY